VLTVPTSNPAFVIFGSATVASSPTILGTSFFLGPDELPLLMDILTPNLNNNYTTIN
jgi:hypothetical protein